MENVVTYTENPDKPLGDFEDSQVSKRDKLRFSLHSLHARVESYLSSHAFVFIFLITYVNAVALMFFWGARDEYVHTTTPTMRWFITVARGWGYTLNLNCALVILLASRLTFTLIRETPLNMIIPFDKSFPAFHIIVGYVILLAAILHGIFHLIWIIGWNRWGAGLWGVNMCVSTGFILLSIFILMVSTSQPKTRSNKFELFYFIHLTGAFLFFVLLLFHGVYNGVPYTYKWITGPLIVYSIDRIIRRLRVINSYIQLSRDNTVLKGANVIQVKLPKQFNYRAGQYAELKVPTIKKFEWHRMLALSLHARTVLGIILLQLTNVISFAILFKSAAFTIASSPHEKDMIFYIKALGDWTNALRDEFQKRLDGTVSDPVFVHIRGPYGAPAQHVAGYQRVVLISGGVGSTPFCSIAKHLHQNIVDEGLPKETVEKMDALDKSPGVQRAEREIRRCVAQAYTQSIPINSTEWDDVVEQNALSVEKLFASANEFQGNLHGAPVVVKKMFDSASPVANRDRPRPFESPKVNRDRPRTKADDHLGRRGRPSNQLDRVGLSFHQPSPLHGIGKHLHSGRSLGRTDTFGSVFAMQTKNVDSIEQANAVREKVGQGFREKWISFFHSIGINLLLYLILLVRAVMLGYASIFRAVSINMSEGASSIFKQKWVVIIDVSLAISLSTILLVSLCLELITYDGAFFRNRGRMIDLFILLPLSALSAYVGMITLLGHGDKNVIPTGVYFGVILPLLFLLIIYRLYRVIGSRVLIADSSKASKFGKIRAVDFIWTTPYSQDDDWLREELEPLANGKQLRLHRFLTREKEGSDESGSSKHGGLSTNYGRPKWDELFTRIAERTPTNGKVGVFFCGPKAMSKAIRMAMMKAQVLSTLRGKYLGTSCDSDLSSHLRLKERAELQQLRSRGSNIRFVFREENFG